MGTDHKEKLIRVLQILEETDEKRDNQKVPCSLTFWNLY